MDKSNIHNSAMLKPELAKHEHIYNELKDGKQVCSECGKLKNERVNTNGLRQRQLHNSSSSSDLPR